MLAIDTRTHASVIHASPRQKQQLANNGASNTEHNVLLCTLLGKMHADLRILFHTEQESAAAKLEVSVERKLQAVFEVSAVNGHDLRNARSELASLLGDPVYSLQRMAWIGYASVMF